MTREHATDTFATQLPFDEALKNPAPSKALYPGLLADQANDEVKPILMGKFVPSHGTIQLTYSEPNHDDLLATYNAFRITEEDSSTNPTMVARIAPTQHRKKRRIAPDAMHKKVIARLDRRVTQPWMPRAARSAQAQMLYRLHRKMGRMEGVTMIKRWVFYYNSSPL